MNPNRKSWNEQQQALQRALLRADDHPKAIELFLSQHAMLHTAEMAQSGLWSFEDEVCQDLSEAAYRRIPRNGVVPVLARDGEHSIAWLLWHIARIEDVTMNLLVAASPQVLQRENWLERLKTDFRDTGNLMTAEDVAHLSATIDVEALRAYRCSVGRRTREIVCKIQPQELKQKVEPARLQQILAEGAVRESAGDLLDYWGNRTIAGLLLMPPTRHNFLHLNEALRIKQKRS